MIPIRRILIFNYHLIQNGTWILPILPFRIYRELILPKLRMFETRVNLGRGILKNLSSIHVDENGVPVESIWETIEDFGIRKEDLKKIEPSYKELFEIYSAIRAYRISVRYLKELKRKFTTID